MTATTKLKCSCSTLRDACAAVHTQLFRPPIYYGHPEARRSDPPQASFINPWLQAATTSPPLTNLHKVSDQTLSSSIYKPWLKTALHYPLMCVAAGISFGSILDPPDDNASDHCLTFPLGPSDLHKDWESDLQNDWGVRLTSSTPPKTGWINWAQTSDHTN